MARLRRRQYVKPKTNAVIRDAELDITAQISDDGRKVTVEMGADRFIGFISTTGDAVRRNLDEDIRRAAQGSKQHEEYAKRGQKYATQLHELWMRLNTRSSNLRFGREKPEPKPQARWPFPVAGKGVK
jgi:hypothetical protein